MIYPAFIFDWTTILAAIGVIAAGVFLGVLAVVLLLASLEMWIERKGQKIEATNLTSDKREYTDARN